MAVNVTMVRYDASRSAIEYVALDIGGVKSRPDAVAEIERGIEYFTKPPDGHGAKIHVVNHYASGKKFLSTNRDETQRDNLGSLPEF